jgi:hypothetical protein
LGFLGPPKPPDPEPLFSSLTAETFLKELLPSVQENRAPEKGGALYTRHMLGRKPLAAFYAHRPVFQRKRTWPPSPFTLNEWLPPLLSTSAPLTA